MVMLPGVPEENEKNKIAFSSRLRLQFYGHFHHTDFWEKLMRTRKILQSACFTPLFAAGASARIEDHSHDLQYNLTAATERPGESLSSKLNEDK